MKMWIARDVDRLLYLFDHKPKHTNSGHLELPMESYIQLGINDFPEVTFENSPQEVELKLIEK